MKNSNELKIVALGDSITVAKTGDCPEELRWVSRVGTGLRALFPQLEITMINAGVGGNTIREGWVRFEQDVTPHQPAIVLIEFGGNDATPEPARHVKLEDFESLLMAMINRCRKLRAQPVLLPFPPLIDLWHHFWPDESFRAKGGKDRFIEQYRRISRKIALIENIPFIDIDRALRTAMEKYGVESQILDDGVHLTVDGNLTVALTVIQELAQWITHGRNAEKKVAPDRRPGAMMDAD